MTTRNPLGIRLAIAAAIVLAVIVVGSVVHHDTGRGQTAAAPTSSTSTSTPPDTTAVSSSVTSAAAAPDPSLAAALPSPTASTTSAAAVPVAAGATVAPAPGAGNDQTPDTAAVAAAIAWYSSDTAVDAGPNAAAVRAAAWLTPDLLAQVEAFAPVGGPGADWTQWASHRAWLQVTAVLSGDDHPADTATAAVRQVAITVTPVGRDGWTAPPTTEVAAVTLTHTAGGWRLQQLRPL